jgi:hypothetical protein
VKNVEEMSPVLIGQTRVSGNFQLKVGAQVRVFQSGQVCVQGVPITGSRNFFENARHLRLKFDESLSGPQAD